MWKNKIKKLSFHFENVENSERNRETKERGRETPTKERENNKDTKEDFAGEELGKEDCEERKSKKQNQPTEKTK